MAEAICISSRETFGGRLNMFAGFLLFVDQLVDVKLGRILVHVLGFDGWFGRAFRRPSWLRGLLSWLWYIIL